jgi:hypothetical protein
MSNKPSLGRTFWDFLVEYKELTIISFCVIISMVIIITTGLIFGFFSLKIGSVEINRKVDDTKIGKDTIIVRDTITIIKKIYITKNKDESLSNLNTFSKITFKDGSSENIISLKCKDLKNFDGIDYGSSLPYFELSNPNYKIVPKDWNKLEINNIKKIEFLRPTPVESNIIKSLMYSRKYDVHKVNVITRDNKHKNNIYILSLEYTTDSENKAYTDQKDVQEIVLN